MRTLVFLFLPLSVFGAPPTSKFSASYKAESGSTGLGDSNASRSTTKITSVDLSTGSIYPKGQVRVGLDSTNADYSRYLTTDRAGTSTPLSRNFQGTEYNLRGGVDAYSKAGSVSVEGAKTMGPTPFPGFFAKSNYSYDVYGWGSRFSASYLRSIKKLPASYFVDPDSLQPKLRPSTTIEKRAEVSWEQILSEIAKSRLNFYLSQKPASRPTLRGAEISLALALKEDQALVGKFGGSKETRNAPLFDDRGYFSAAWAQLEWRFQPSYRWNFAFQMGTILEMETARGRIPYRKVGTDSMGAEVRHVESRWEIGFHAVGSSANTGYKSLQSSGEFIWKL